MSDDLTDWLNQARAGNPVAGQRAFSAIYQELKTIAQAALNRHQQTLSATALVHDAYLRIMPGQSASIENRKHFFRLVARAMRQILVDQARARQTEKRGGEWVRTELPEQLAVDGVSLDLIAVDQAVTRLADKDPELAEIVEAYFFAGQSFADIAEHRDISERTVRRLWETARLALYHDLSQIPDTGPD